jgi:hypothetical protein
MSKNALHRHYDRLTPEERFRLDVLAMARGDAVESERLVGSCPKLSYRMNDRAFAGRWAGAMDITLRTYIALEKLLSNLQMIDAFRQLVPYAQVLSRSVATESYFVGHNHGSLRAWVEAGEVGRPPAWPESDAEKPKGAEEDPAVGRGMEDLDWKLNKYGELLPEIMDRMERELAGDALTLRGLLCREHGGSGREDPRGDAPGGAGRGGRRACRGPKGPGGAPWPGARRGERRGDTQTTRRSLARGRRKGRLGVGLRNRLRRLAEASEGLRRPLPDAHAARRRLTVSKTNLAAVVAGLGIARRPPGTLYGSSGR